MARTYNKATEQQGDNTVLHLLHVLEEVAKAVANRGGWRCCLICGCLTNQDDPGCPGCRAALTAPPREETDDDAE